MARPSLHLNINIFIGMSKAYLVAKNFTWPEMMNLICYGAKHPETLS